jgi:sulfotransferase famil protein
MIVCLHIPKTGGTSFNFILENNFGFRNCHTNQNDRSTFTQADLEFARKCYPALRSIVGHNLVDPAQLTVPEPFYMTILREPVARVISHYQYSVQRGNNKKSFEETLRASENLENLQVKIIAGGRDLDKAKRFLERCAFVGLTEKFDLSLRVLERLSPWPLKLGYQRRVVAESNTLKDALKRDERMLELAREYNKLDLALYQFAVDEIFPRLCEKARVNPAEKVPPYSSDAPRETLNYRLSKVYSKVFRNICKFRYNVLLHDSRPRMGNTAEDIFAPFLERDAARRV